MLKIIDPVTPDDFDAVRKLCWECRDFLLRLSAHFTEIVRALYPADQYTRVLDTLPTDYIAHDGGIKLLLLDGSPMGCGMYHRLESRDAEVKRVFMRPEARGQGAGRALMDALVLQCRNSGFKRILMDTGKPLKSATQLYLSMGFVQRGPYQAVPNIAKDTLLFFEMRL